MGPPKKILLFLLVGIFIIGLASAGWEDAIISNPIMTNFTTPAPAVVSASSQLSDYYAWLSFDGTALPTTNIGAWCSDSVPTPCWVVLDMGEGNDFIATNLTIELSDTGTTDPKDFQFQGSNDSNTWETLTSGINPQGTGNTTYDFIDNLVSYRYYRQYVTDNHASSGNIRVGDELYIWGFSGNQYPIVNLNLPPTNSNYTDDPSLVNFSCNVSDAVGITNVSFLIDGVIDQTNTSGINDTQYNFQKSLTQGGYEWTCEATNIDNLTAQAANRTVIIHTTPVTLSVLYPTGNLGYIRNGEELKLNWSISESGENLTTHIVNCTYEYNGTITEVNNTVCTQINETTFTYIAGVETITFTAIDEYGFITNSTTSWTYQFLESSRVFSPIALQTATETFQLTGIRDSSITSTSAVMHYNGNEYTSLKTGSGDNVILTNVIGVPTDLEGNINFYWTITYTNATGTYSFNTTNSTQEVFALSLEECFAPAVDGLTLNFTTYETTNLSALNSSFEATFQFYAEGGTGSMIVEYLFSDLNENRSNYMFCLNSSGQNVTLDAFISYAATDYDRREYIIDDGIIGNFTQSIPLYLTLTELTDIVTVTVQDQTFDPIAGALVAIQEWNVGTNTYSTIGMLTTSSSGQGIIDLELYTTWYRAVVYIDGVLTHVEDVQKLSSTSWIITVETGEDNPYDLFGNIAHGLTFDNETNITSFTWLDISGYTNRGCMIVQNTTSLGPETIFNSCVTSVSGTIDYQLVGDGDYTIYGIIFLEGYNTSQIVETLNIRLGTPEITKTVSPFGKVISFISIGTAGLIGVSAGSVILGGILIIAVLVFLMKMGFMNIAWGFVWGITSIIIISWFLQRRKR